MKHCPRCKSVSRYRMKRKGFVKFIGGAKAYECDKCDTRYTWFPLLDISLKV